MRRAEYSANDDAAWALLDRVDVARVAGNAVHGAPIIRVVHPITLDRRVFFHAAPAGEKMDLLGTRVVLAAEQIIAEIPSYFVDPERACPATTYYDSAQIDGHLRAIEDPELKARVLQALMQKYQSEGGYRPICQDDPMYRAAVKNLLIAEVVPLRVSAKFKVGQNKKPHEIARIIDGLWQRGGPGDLQTIETILAHHQGDARPAFLRVSDHLIFRVAPSARDREESAGLVTGTYWNVGIEPETLSAAVAGSSAWVGVYDTAERRLIGTSRAMCDEKRAYIFDVAISRHHQGLGLGSQMMNLLLDHPAVRRCGLIALRTRDAMPFYERLGFQPIERAYPSTEMMLRRPGA